jgi:serine/threonine protein kinase
VILDFASRLLSALSFLHSKKFKHVPGDINSNRIYFTQTYESLLLDVGRASSHISPHWLFQNYEALLSNPFVAPECKDYLKANSQKIGNNNVFKIRKKSDVYSFGVLLYMITVLIHDPEELSTVLSAPLSRVNFPDHLVEHLEALPTKQNYRPKIIPLIVRALNPVPGKRASVKELLSVISNKTAPAQVGEGPKILLSYNIIRRIDHYSLAVSLRDENKVNTIDPEDELYGCNMRGKMKAGVFLIQHKTTSGQYIAHNFLFTDYNDAFRYRNTKWRETSEIEQKNLVRVANIYLQMLDNFQFQVTIIKKKHHSDFMDFIASRKQMNKYLEESVIIGYTLQLIDALFYLYSWNQRIAPGDINPGNIYLKQTQEDLFLDVRRVAPSVCMNWIQRNSRTLLRNPFVAPEYREYIASISQSTTTTTTTTSTEKEQVPPLNYSDKADFYSIGVLIYMMITLDCDYASISSALNVPQAQNPDVYFNNHLRTVTRAHPYSTTIIHLLLKLLNPNPDRRYSLDEIRNSLRSNCKLGEWVSSNIPKTTTTTLQFADEFNILSIERKSLSQHSTILAGMDLKRISLPDTKRSSMTLLLGSESLMFLQNHQQQTSFCVFQVENKHTRKKYSALSVSFSTEKEATQCEDTFKQMSLFNHLHLVSIVKTFVQKDSSSNQYQVFIVKDLYTVNLIDFLVNRKKKDNYLSEELLLELCYQLLSAVEYLHCQKYIHAPGAINAYSVFFTDNNNNVLLDIGMNSSSIPTDWILKNSQSLLSNPFVAPEYKPFFLTRSRRRTSQAPMIEYTETGDIYSIAVLLFMLTTLTHDISSLSAVLAVPKTKSFEAHIRDVIQSASEHMKYSNKLIELIQKALQPDPSMRPTTKELLAFCKSE